MKTQGGFEPMTIWPIYEKKKILAEGGFDPQISGRECKMLPLSYVNLLKGCNFFSLLYTHALQTV